MMFDSTSLQLPLGLADGSSEQWTVRTSPRARRLSVRVLHNGHVEVIAPRRTSPRTITHFVYRHRQWIERKRAEAVCHALPLQPFPPAQIELTACAESWRIHLAGSTQRPRARIVAPGLLSLSGDLTDRRAAQSALRRWLTTKAHEFLAPLLATIALQHDFKYRQVTIRWQRTRWGSCSTRGTISLNACLLFQRPAVVRYLLLHELAHTRHMNHSRRFWQCVAKCCPDFKSLDRSLREGWRNVPQWLLHGR